MCDPFSPRGTAALELACDVGKVARALSWERAPRAIKAADADAADCARAPLATLSALLNPSYLAGGWPSS